MRNSDKNKQKRLVLELISHNLNTFHNKETKVSLVDYSVKDFTNNKTYVLTKKGLETKNMKSINDKGLEHLLSYLDIILKTKVGG